ncbi:MAG: 16S rRNA (guanine(527)-N(7))-methyltransferase RsmG [Tannerellaceae bacterium]|jgi:16S rRNA (guanine527-N7)-methyltransferase|nr:16S rRNA (guanine(527)-N(7))-methyltransferase RsmG [Tannerellaceae bacterium]
MTGNAQFKNLLGYFPELEAKQCEQLSALEELYTEWNSKINVVSRKDIDNLYLHHVQHSLGIIRLIRFSPGSSIMDLGTGGGFPGIPLAIYYPDVRFRLVDSIGKKIKVAEAVATAIGLTNVTFFYGRAENETEHDYDFVVSRAVATPAELAPVAARLISRKQRSALPNGLICLRGSDPTGDGSAYSRRQMSIDLRKYYKETYYHSKKVLYIPL